MKSLIYFGGTLKAVDDNGKIGGYLVRFSDDGGQKDLAGEYFTSKTYLGAHEGDGVDTIFHHAQPIPVKSGMSAAMKKEIAALQDKIFAPIKTKRDVIGLWAETVLDMADEYQAAVFGLVKAEKLGWSSGAVAHMVKKLSDGQITRWPIGEASITPCPCEPLNRTLALDSLDTVKFIAIDDSEERKDEPELSIKENSLAGYLNQLIDDRVDDGRTKRVIIGQMAQAAGLDVKAVEQILASESSDRPVDAHLKAFARVLGVKFSILKSTAQKQHASTIKGIFAEAIDAITPSLWDLESTYSSVIRKIARLASSASVIDGSFDLESLVAEATGEYTGLLEKHAVAQIRDYVETGGDDDFYFKAILDAEGRVKSFSATDLDSHSRLTVSVFRDLAARFRSNHEARTKAGRVLSEKNRQRISSVLDAFDAVSADLRALLEESQPMADEAEKRALLVKQLLRNVRNRQSEYSQ